MLPSKISTVGAIQLGKVLGTGGNATVYKGIHSIDDSEVAIKILHPSTSITSHNIEQEFFQEIQSAAALNHPRITDIYDYGTLKGNSDHNPEDSSSHWLTMELIEGGTIKDLIGSLTWNELQQILLDLLDALSHAHARRLIHRDIKPRNVLFDAQSKRIKLTDFGLVRSFDFVKDNALVQETSILGTPYYMAPEQILKETLSFGPWTDLYAVGCLAWEMTCGRPPYTGEIHEVFRLHLQGTLPSFEPLFDVPDGFYDWLLSLLNRDSNARCQQAAYAAFQLQQIGTDEYNAPIGNPVVFDFDDDLETQAHTGVFFDDRTQTQSTKIVWAPIDYQSTGIAGYTINTKCPPFPDNWRQTKETEPQLNGTGLQLFTLRTRKVIGRESIRDQLWSICRTVCTEKHPRLVVLEGTLGVGKSSLATWLAHRSSEVGAAQWLSFSFNASQDNEAHIGEVIGANLRILNLPYDQALQRTKHIIQALGLKHQQDATNLLALAQLNKNNPEGNQHIKDRKHPLTLKERYSLIYRFLVGLSKVQPLVLVLNGVQHIPDILALVKMLLQDSDDAAICVLVTTSVSDTDSTPRMQQTIHTLKQHSAVDVIEVQPLTSIEQIRFIQDLLGLTPEVASKIEHKCAGNPKIAIQIVSSLIEQNVLTLTREGFVLREDVEVNVPNSIMDVWTQRYQNILEHWPAKELCAFEMGAVLGNTVDPIEWEHALHKADLLISPSLMHHLQRKRLIVLDSDSGRWTFVHSLFRDAVLAHLAKDNRRQAYSKVAVSIISDNQSTIDRRARLWVHAGDPEAALSPLCEAAIINVGRTELGRAQRLRSLRNTILKEYPIDPEGKHALGTEILDLLLLPPAKQVETLEKRGAELIQWAIRVEDWKVLLKIQQSRAVHSYQNGHTEKGRQLYKECLHLAKKHRSEDIVNILNRMSFFGTTPSERIEYAREAIFESEKLGDIAKIGSSYLHLSMAHNANDDVPLALFCLEEARIRFVHTDFRTGLSSVYHNKGELLHRTNDFEGAEQAYLLAIESQQLVGQNNFNMFINRVNLLITYFHMKNFEKATAVSERLITSASDSSTVGLPKVARLIATLCSAPCLAWSNRWDALKEALEQIRIDLTVFNFTENDVYTLLDFTLDFCQRHQQSKISRLIWTIQHEQLLREGLFERAQAVELLLKS